MRGKFSAFLLVPQVAFILLYAFFVEYGPAAAGSSNKTHTEETINTLYPMFQDVHVMIFIGFGFLMTFLKRYGFGSVGFNLLLSAFVIQWIILMRGSLHTKNGKIELNLETLLNADFGCGAVLISFGAVLGVLSPVQLLVMAFLEVVVYSLNELIIIDHLGISDIGGSMVIHTFGAYFGLAVAFLHWREKLASDETKEGSVYHSDIFAMIGTLFLWVFWPSFNGAPAAGTYIGARAVINTVYSLSASAVASFALSSIVDKKGKLSMVHVQNATLAGGVAAGAVANLKLGPTGAIILGSTAGLLSVIGYAYISPALQRSIKLHDTCGVHNLHGMPGVLSAFVAVVLARLSTPSSYMGPDNELGSIYSKATDSPDFFRHQANMQMAGLAVTLAMSIVGGLLTGLLLKIPFLDPVSDRYLFDDFNYWLLNDDDSSEKSGKPFKELMLVEEVSSDREDASKKKAREAAEEEKTYEDTTLSQQEQAVES